MLDLSQVDIAAMIGANYQSIARFERGEHASAILAYAYRKALEEIEMRQKQEAVA
jgi:DNA-binding XRE family transcriptional regulator